MVAAMGQPGPGKSTLLEIICRLDHSEHALTCLLAVASIRAKIGARRHRQ